MGWEKSGLDPESYHSYYSEERNIQVSIYGRGLGFNVVQIARYSVEKSHYKYLQAYSELTLALQNKLIPQLGCEVDDSKFSIYWSQIIHRLDKTIRITIKEHNPDFIELLTTWLSSLHTIDKNIDRMKIQHSFVRNSLQFQQPSIVGDTLFGVDGGNWKAFCVTKQALQKYKPAEDEAITIGSTSPLAARLDSALQENSLSDHSEIRELLCSQALFSTYQHCTMREELYKLLGYYLSYADQGDYEKALTIARKEQKLRKLAEFYYEKYLKEWNIEYLVHSINIFYEIKEGEFVLHNRFIYKLCDAYLGALEQESHSSLSSSPENGAEISQQKKDFERSLLGALLRIDEERCVDEKSRLQRLLAHMSNQRGFPEVPLAKDNVELMLALSQQVSGQKRKIAELQTEIQELKSLSPEMQVKFLEKMGQQRLAQVVYVGNIAKVLESLMPEAQACLIKLLGSDSLKKIIPDTLILVYDVLRGLGDKLKENRILLLKTLGPEGLEDIFNKKDALSLHETIEIFKKENQHEAATDLERVMNGVSDQQLNSHAQKESQVNRFSLFRSSSPPCIEEAVAEKDHSISSSSQFGAVK